jgi:hypothetical protein
VRVNDGFSVQEAALLSASQSLAEQRQVPTDLASSMSGARAVDTGDPGVNSGLDGVVTQIAELMTQLSGVIGGYAQGLNQTVDNYRSIDQDAARLLDALRRSLTPDDPATSPPPAPTSSLGITEKLG